MRYKTLFYIHSKLSCYTDSHLVKFIANWGVCVGCIFSPVGGNAFFWWSRLPVKTDDISTLISPNIIDISSELLILTAVNGDGDSTEPCLTPKFTLKVADHTSFHLTHATQLPNQFLKITRTSAGTCRFISLRYKPWWLTLSNAFDKSIEHKFAVHSPFQLWQNYQQ